MNSGKATVSPKEAKNNDSTSMKNAAPITIREMVENGYYSGRSGKEYILKVK